MKIKPNIVITLVITVGVFGLASHPAVAVDTFSNQQAENTPSTQDDTDSKAEIAIESYEESDATPTGSWASGCSPESATETSVSIDEEDCLPQDTQDTHDR